MSRSSRVLHRFLRILVRLICLGFVRLEVHNRERLPIAGPYILAPVHRSNVDVFIAAATVPSRVVLRTVAKDSLWKVAWFGRFLEKMGSVPVDRERVDRAALRRCEDALGHGEPLLMFPEGRRKEGPVVEDVLEGPAWLACRAQVPIVPVGVAGTDQVMPIGSKMLRPRKVVVWIGEPLIPQLQANGRVRHANVVSLTEQLRDAIQTNYDKACRELLNDGCC